MAINRFDKPVLTRYVSQYVPAPIETMAAFAGQIQQKSDKIEDQMEKSKLYLNQMDVLQKDLELKNEKMKSFNDKLYKATEGVNDFSNPDVVRKLKEAYDEHLYDEELQIMVKNKQTVKAYMEERKKAYENGTYLPENDPFAQDLLNYQGVKNKDGSINALNYTGIYKAENVREGVEKMIDQKQADVQTYFDFKSNPGYIITNKVESLKAFDLYNNMFSNLASLDNRYLEQAKRTGEYGKKPIDDNTWQAMVGANQKVLSDLEKKLTDKTATVGDQVMYQEALKKQAIYNQGKNNYYTLNYLSDVMDSVAYEKSINKTESKIDAEQYKLAAYKSQLRKDEINYRETLKFKLSGAGDPFKPKDMNKDKGQTMTSATISKNKKEIKGYLESNGMTTTSDMELFKQANGDKEKFLELKLKKEGKWQWWENLKANFGAKGENEGMGILSALVENNPIIKGISAIFGNDVSWGISDIPGGTPIGLFPKLMGSDWQENHKIKDQVLNWSEQFDAMKKGEEAGGVALSPQNQEIVNGWNKTLETMYGTSSKEYRDWAVNTADKNQVQTFVTRYSDYLSSEPVITPLHYGAANDMPKSWQEYVKQEIGTGAFVYAGVGNSDEIQTDELKTMSQWDISAKLDLDNINPINVVYGIPSMPDGAIYAQARDKKTDKLHGFYIPLREDFYPSTLSQERGMGYTSLGIPTVWDANLMNAIQSLQMGTTTNLNQEFKTQTMGKDGKLTEQKVNVFMTPTGPKVKFDNDAEVLDGNKVLDWQREAKTNYMFSLKDKQEQEKTKTDNTDYLEYSQSFDIED